MSWSNGKELAYNLNKKSSTKNFGLSTKDIDRFTHAEHETTRTQTKAKVTTITKSSFTTIEMSGKSGSSGNTGS